jgi:hypothetical protein
VEFTSLSNKKASKSQWSFALVKRNSLRGTNWELRTCDVPIKATPKTDLINIMNENAKKTKTQYPEIGNKETTLMKSSS